MVERLNRGEWSEIYAFIKVLSERQLLAADADLTPLPDVFYPCLLYTSDAADEG